MSVIVGLDLSLTGTGMCRIEGDAVKWKVVGTGPQAKKASVRYQDDVWEAMRLGKLLAQISAFCMGADLVGIEDFAKMTGKGGGGLRIGLAYLVRYWCWKQGIPFMVVGTGQVKKFASGKAAEKGADGLMHGTAKVVIIREVYKLWGHNVDDDNEADSVVIAHVVAAVTGHREPDTRYSNGEALPVARTAAQKAVVAELRKKYPEVCR